MGLEEMDGLGDEASPARLFIWRGDQPFADELIMLSRAALDAAGEA